MRINKNIYYRYRRLSTTNRNDKYWRGITGLNVATDKDGIFSLTNNEKYNINKPGVYLTSI